MKNILFSSDTIPAYDGCGAGRSQFHHGNKIGILLFMTFTCRRQLPGGIRMAGVASIVLDYENYPFAVTSYTVQGFIKGK
jgi:hypothetical protein